MFPHYNLKLMIIPKSGEQLSNMLTDELASGNARLSHDPHLTVVVHSRESPVVFPGAMCWEQPCSLRWLPDN